MAKLSDLSLYDQFEYAKRFNQFPANGTLTEFVKSRPALQASQAAAAPIPQINELTPDQINEEFYKGYPKDLPQRKTFRDYINPASYVDPIAPLLNRGADPARVMPDPTDASATNRSSMPNFNLGNLTNYIPSASTIGEYIPTSIPNVFGVNNPLYAGLLGADQSQALSKQSNIAGLLGAAAALVQGMGRQGGRRSAAQNIISALGAGYGSAGQQYQQGLQMYGQTQQLGLQQRQQAAIQAMKLKYPEYADEIDANPAGAFRLIAERETANKKGIVVDGNLVNPITGAVIFKADKSKARILTADEVTAQGLPTTGGQKYQVDANGKIDLIQGTAPTKPATSIEEWQFYKSTGGKKDYETFKKDTAQQQNLSFTLPSDPAKRAQALSDNSQKFTANKPIAEAFEVANRYDNFSKAYNNPQAGGASDAVLIYSMAKMLDPGGAVQQGDVGTIAGQKSIPEKLKAIHEQFISNRTLSDEQRENLNAMAYSIVKNKQKSINPIIKQYRNYANALASPDAAADVQDPFQNIELPKQRLVTINKKKTQIRLGNDGNYYYTDPTGKNYIYND
jgi:hypothetical protein